MASFSLSLLPPTLTKSSEHCHSNHHKTFNAEWHVIITNNKQFLPQNYCTIPTLGNLWGGSVSSPPEPLWVKLLSFLDVRRISPE